MLAKITRPLTLLQPVNRHKNLETMNTQAKHVSIPKKQTV